LDLPTISGKNKHSFYGYFRYSAAGEAAREAFLTKSTAVARSDQRGN
jgi:hypothetical protein